MKRSFVPTSTLTASMLNPLRGSVLRPGLPFNHVGGYPGGFPGGLPLSAPYNPLPLMPPNGYLGQNLLANNFELNRQADLVTNENVLLT